MPHFFAYIDRMKYIQRWNTMRNSRSENIQEHSLQVAILAHALAIIKNHYYEGHVNAEYTALLAIYHEASEVITGDLATPIKYYSPEFRKAYRELEVMASSRLSDLLPPELQPYYADLLSAEPTQSIESMLVKAADKLAAYLKCLDEVKSGNREFQSAHDAILIELRQYPEPAVQHFLDHFADSYSLNLDELNKPQS